MPGPHSYAAWFGTGQIQLLQPSLRNPETCTCKAFWAVLGGSSSQAPRRGGPARRPRSLARAEPQQGTLIGATQVECLPVGYDLERTEDAELHRGLQVWHSARSRARSATNATTGPAEQSRSVTGSVTEDVRRPRATVGHERAPPEVARKHARFDPLRWRAAKSTGRQLAHERTYLAWWRTGLAGIAAGFAVGRVLPEVVGGTNWPYIALGTALAASGLAAMVYGIVHYRELQAALREDREPHTGEGSVLASPRSGSR